MMASSKCSSICCRKRGKENTIARDYVLPDYTHIKRGFVRPMEETTGRAKDGEQVRIKLLEEKLYPVTKLGFISICPYV